MCADDVAPVRPSIPGVAWLAAGLWVGIAVAESAAWSSYGGVGQTVGVHAVALGFVAVVVAVLSRSAGATLLAAGFVAGAAAGWLVWGQWARDVRAVNAARGEWEVECVGDPIAGPFGARSDVYARIDGRRVELSARWPQDCRPPEAGRRVSLRGSLTAPGRDEWGRRAMRSLTCGTLKVTSMKDVGWALSLRGLVGPTRARAINAIGRVPGAGGDLLAGVVVGDRRRLSGTQTESDFRTTGLTHLVAVSGSHLVVVAALLGLLLSAARVPRAVGAATTVVVLGAYVVATGVQSSAVRAWLMAACVAGSGVMGRRSDSIASVAVAAIVAIAFTPSVVFDLGFQLSVAAVLGLVVFARLTQAWVRVALPHRAEWLAAPLALTLTAQAVTAPLTTTAFGTVSLIAPVANVFAGPLISGALLAGLAGVALDRVWAPAGRWTLQCAGALGNLTADGAAWLAGVPGASVAVDATGGALALGGTSLAAALWITWPRPRKLLARAIALVAACVAMAAAIGPPAPSGPHVVFLDVGQGDAVLVRDGATTALVDAGPSASALQAALARHGVRRIQTLILTHLHDDHYAGVAALEDGVDVGSVIVAEGAGNQLPREVSGLGVKVTEAVAGDRIDVGSVLLNVLSPLSAVQAPEENCSSLVLTVEAGERRILLTGDAEGDVLDSLANAGVLPDVDVLKVGHHGSSGAVSTTSMRLLRPELAVISVGAGNRFGHPAPSTVSDLEESGSRVLRTDLVGDITAIPSGAVWRIGVQRRGHARFGCATLVAARSRMLNVGAHEPRSHRPQAHLPDRQRAGVPARPGSHAPEEARWRGG